MLYRHLCVLCELGTQRHQ